MYPFVYKTTFFDEIDSTMSIAYGVSFAANLKEAASNIEDFYGNTIDKCTISFIDDTSSVLEISEDIYNALKSKS